MGRYSDFRENRRLAPLLADLNAVGRDVLDRLEQLHGPLPVDYAEFLEDHGGGLIGNAAFCLYGGLLAPDEVYDRVAADGLQGLLLFGDDLQGYCTAFDTDDGWAVVEIDPRGADVSRIADTFEAFLRNKLAELDAGI